MRGDGRRGVGGKDQGDRPSGTCASVGVCHVHLPKWVSHLSAGGAVSAAFFAGVAPCTMKLAPGKAWKAGTSVGSLIGL